MKTKNIEFERVMWIDGECSVEAKITLINGSE